MWFEKHTVRVTTLLKPKSNLFDKFTLLPAITMITKRLILLLIATACLLLADAGSMPRPSAKFQTVFRQVCTAGNAF